MVFRLGGPGPPWARFLEGARHTFWPLLLIRGPIIGGGAQDPPGPPYNYFTVFTNFDSERIRTDALSFLENVLCATF